MSNLIAEANAYLTTLGPEKLVLNAGLSVLVIVGAAICSFALSRATRILVKRLARRLKSSLAHTARAFRLAARLTQLGVWIVGVSLVASLWGVNAIAWATGPGAPLFFGALRILLVIVLATVAWEAAVLAIESGLNRAADRSGNARRAAQLRSLAPMLRGAVRTFIAVFAGMVIISQLEVEIGPLLAGASVVGVAVGFGAQTLVKDYLTGFSLILEDIVSVGDIVRIGDSGGLVEMMALRTIRLRDFDGTLHAIPYSEAQTVHNLTKTFSYYVFNIPVSYNSDIDHALSLMRSVGDELRNDANFTKDILEPIEVVGVDSLADSAVVLKARIKTMPVRQWSVGREYNRRIKLAFDDAGIEIPVPHLKLLLSDRALEAVSGGP